jgi:hypothetical protein
MTDISSDPETNPIRFTQQAKVNLACPNCGKIDTKVCSCLEDAPLWKVSLNAVRVFRDRFQFHVPADLGHDPWDDRLFFKTIDQEYNQNFLGLEQFTSESRFIREALLDSYANPSDTLGVKPEVGITDGGNLYEKEVPRGTFEGQTCKILREADIQKVYAGVTLKPRRPTV